LRQILRFVDELLKRKVYLIALKENLELKGEKDLRSKVTIAMFGLFAEIERDLISQRTKEALQQLQLKGQRLGRPKGSLGKSKLDGKEKEIKQLLAKEVSLTSIAKIIGASRSTPRSFIKSRKLV